MHDLLITAGVYSLTGREVTTSTVAALLTILGYSLYDTIIVFDRVRENVPRMPRAAFSQIVNRSMSEVLTRSLATTLLHAAAGPRAAALRRRDAQGLRVRADGRRRVRRVLVDLHRLAGAHALEGARARSTRRRVARHRARELGVVPAYAVARRRRAGRRRARAQAQRRRAARSPRRRSPARSRAEEFEEMVRRPRRRGATGRAARRATAEARTTVAPAAAARAEADAAPSTRRARPTPEAALDPADDGDRRDARSTPRADLDAGGGRRVLDGRRSRSRHAKPPTNRATREAR